MDKRYRKLCHKHDIAELWVLIKKKSIFVNEVSTHVSQYIYSLVSFPANICLTGKKDVGHLHIGSHLIGLCQCQSL